MKSGIIKETAIVYYAPTRGRRYFVKSAAIKNEAIAIILKRYPIEHFEFDTGHSYDIRYDEPERFERMLSLLSYKIKQSLNH